MCRPAPVFVFLSCLACCLGKLRCEPTSASSQGGQSTCLGGAGLRRHCTAVTSCPLVSLWIIYDTRASVSNKKFCPSPLAQSCHVVVDSCLSFSFACFLASEFCNPHWAPVLSVRRAMMLSQEKGGGCLISHWRPALQAGLHTLLPQDNLKVTSAFLDDQTMLYPQATAQGHTLAFSSSLISLHSIPANSYR